MEGLGQKNELQNKLSTVGRTEQTSTKKTEEEGARNAQDFDPIAKPNRLSEQADVLERDELIQSLLNAPRNQRNRKQNLAAYSAALEIPHGERSPRPQRYAMCTADSKRGSDPKQKNLAWR